MEEALHSETRDFPTEKGNRGIDRTARTAIAHATRRRKDGDKPAIKQEGGVLRELKEMERSLD